MKKTGFVLLILLLMAGYHSSAQTYKTALGIRLSSDDAIVNHSISLKHFLGNAVALEGLLSFGDPVALGFLIEKHKPVQVAGMMWFYGGGAYVGFGKQKNFGLHGVLGLDYKFPTAPINVSLDWKPELNLANEVAFEPAAIGLSMRFTFR